MRKLVFLLLLVACPVYGQGVEHYNFAWWIGPNATSLLLPGATVTVCAGTTLPNPGVICSPTTTIYGGPGLVPNSQANPFTADSHGNYSFWSPTGASYVISVSAPGFTAYSYSWTAPLSSNANAVVGSINGVLYIDGTVYPLTAAGINAADTALGSSAGVINVTHPGSYCGATVTLSNGHTLIFGAGTYTVNIAGADSNSSNVTWGVSGQGSNQTTLQSCPTTNKDVITSQNFGTFTGGTNFYGVFHPVIRGLTIDGNKANETAGFGIRLYGRSPAPSDILTQNCFQDGQWWEWGGTENDIGSANNVNGNGVVLESDYNNGNGFSFKTAGASPGSINTVGNMIAHNNGGWGFQSQYAITLGQINTYLNTSGGCDIQSGGTITATAASCTTVTGWGLLQEAGSGQIDIKGGFLTGGIPLELRNSSGGTIMGQIGNPAAATTCLKLNGAANFVISAEFISCSTSLIAFVSETGPNFITGIGTTGATLYTGTPSIQDSLTLTVSGGAKYVQTSIPTILGGSGALLLSPTAPTITTHFNTSGDSITSNGTAAIVVTTGTGAGTTTGTIGLPTANNGWSCWINGAGVSLPTQTSSTVSSASFTNYNTSLTPVNWTNGVSLRIGCMGY
jgi:hypothetical protein